LIYCRKGIEKVGPASTKDSEQVLSKYINVLNGSAREVKKMSAFSKLNRQIKKTKMDKTNLITIKLVCAGKNMMCGHKTNFQST
jgi:hypothetical protein